MAANTVLNLGTGGDTIRTEDFGGGVKGEAVKLHTGAVDVDGGPVTSDNPLAVANLGFPVSLQTDVTLPTASIYAVGDAIANSTSAPTAGGFTFTGAARVSGGSGIITDLLVSSSLSPATRLAGELWIFNQAVTAINDNAAFVLSDAEIKTVVGIVPFSLFSAGANNSIAHILGINALFTCVGSANLRFLIRARNTYTPAVSEVLSFTPKIIQLN